MAVTGPELHESGEGKIASLAAFFGNGAYLPGDVMAPPSTIHYQGWRTVTVADVPVVWGWPCLLLVLKRGSCCA